jgi:hypothetical protein
MSRSSPSCAKNILRLLASKDVAEMQDQKTHGQSLGFRHWKSRRVNSRIQHPSQLRLLDNKSPNLADGAL